MAAIYYLFTEAPFTGGDMVSVDHIAALNRMGFRASAYYVAPDTGIRQFSVPAVPGSTALQPDDVLVMGELHRPFYEKARHHPCIRVQHNQNPYFSFYGFDDVGALNAYPFASLLVPSDFCAGMLRTLGVTHPIARVHPALPDWFKPAPKRLQIVCSALKRGLEATFLAPYFRAKVPEFAHVPWIVLNRVPRQEVARVMGESAIYAALPFMESLGLMQLEAMASGCHVAGYTGQGGAEYATPENGDWITDGDHDGFVAALADACRLFQSGESNPRIAAGHATAARFSQGGFETQLREAWISILGGKLELYRK